ncbi:MAG: hypothetical protein ACK41W_07810 [Cyanobacteriota bacterium]|jgi:predicted MFS family arabinose efflux permease
MSCCGQKRRAWSVRRAPDTPGRQSSPPTPRNPTLVYYSAKTSLLINGQVTGFTYLFAGGGSGLRVDERDVPALMRLQGFQIVSPET